MGTVTPIGPYKRVYVAALYARFVAVRRTPHKALEFRHRPHLTAPTRLVHAVANVWDKELRKNIRRPRAERFRLFPLLKLVGVLKRQPSVLVDWARTPRTQRHAGL